MQGLITGFIVWYLVFLFSTTLHEAAHSFLSAYGGDRTAHSQATLNPVPHIQRNMFGMVAAPVLTFALSRGAYLLGWSGAPFNIHWAARHPRRALLMALAGPLSHLPLLALSFSAMYFGLRSGFFVPAFLGDEMLYPVAPASAGNVYWAVAALCNVCFRLNLILFIFNLLPLPPLDGSEIWYAFMKREETRLRWRYQAASYGLAGLMLAWWLFPRVLQPVEFTLVFRVLFG